MFVIKRNLPKITPMVPRSVIACCHTLLEKKLTISFAESVTTGKLIYDFSSVPDCGTILKGSIVCYDASVKENLFGISEEIIKKYTPESQEVTLLLAEGLKKLIPADVIVAVTGLASPGGSESEEKPVGTIFVNGYIKDKAWMTKLHFEGSPDEIIGQTSDAIASILLDELTNLH